MTAEPRTAERRITAFMEDPDAPRPGNPIHSTSGGTEYGYRAALVGGVTVYGWAAPAIMEALGDGWLDHGWCEVSFRRPTYPGDEMTARLTEQPDGSFALDMTNQDGKSCLVGLAGLGDAPWLGEMLTPERLDPEPKPDSLPQLTLDNAPIDQDLRPQAVEITEEQARRYATEQVADEHPLFLGERPRIHPGWIAARMSPYMHHTFEYAPSIHSKSHIQHLAPAFAGQTVTIGGRGVEVFERKGHQYIAADGLITGEDGTRLARVRHTTIFNVEKRGQG
jgi:acyl dehydratase